MLPTRAKLRPGLSIIEFLAVLALISLFLLVLIPALLRARLAAGRVQCINNMKQIVLALHTYHESHQTLPPGTVSGPGPIQNLGDEIQISWVIQLLPMMEQSSVWQLIVSDMSGYYGQNVTARSTRLNSLLCPIDRGTIDAAPANSWIGVSSYAACHNDTEEPIREDNRGVLFLNSRIRSQDVHDGTSNTIYIGEKLLVEGDRGWMSGTRATLRNTGATINSVSPTFGPADQDGPANLYVGGFGSHHDNGSNFGFGDGSVHFIKQTIDEQVYRYLGNRSDGELIREGEIGGVMTPHKDSGR